MTDFLRPLGLIGGAAAAQAIADGVARRLAGGPIAFTGVQKVSAQGGGGSVLAVGDARVDAGALAVLTVPRPPFAGLEMDAGPKVMAIINVTPDSFSDGGRFAGPEQAVDAALTMAEAGADILDIGGESTRPGAAPVTSDEEQRRVIPVIEGIRRRLGTGGPRLSIDTRHAATMRAAILAGADIVNDVSGLTHDPEALTTVADLGCPAILMHMRGTPQNMQAQTDYHHAPAEICAYLARRIAVARAAGIDAGNLAADFGIGFGKTAAQNAALLASTGMFHSLGVPLLIGASRKSFIAKLSRDETADRRLPGSLAAALGAVGQGAQIIRVHDVAETVQALEIQRGLERF